MKNLDSKEIPVFEEMIRRKLIPPSGQFDVTRELAEAAFWIYREIYPPKSNKIDKGEKSFNVRMKSLNLIKLNKYRSEQETIIVSKNASIDTKGGFVYVISNPCFPGVVKIGMTKDLKRRLQIYQTGDPKRGYVVDSYVFVNDARKAEKAILEKYKSNVAEGEWVDSKFAKLIIKHTKNSEF